MSNYKTMAKRPKGKEYENVTMIDGVYGTHYYGVRFPDGKVYPEDKCEIMKSHKEELEEELNDETKSPLDEFIDDRKKGIYEIIGSAVSIPEYLEESIRLAVQKHSEAVIPKPYGYLQHMSSKEQYDRGNGYKECIEDIKSASDKWIGV